VTQSRAAFHQLLDTLAASEIKYIGPGRGVTSVEDNAEGTRFMTHVLRTRLELLLAQDPSRPSFTSQVHGSLKMLGDNPDAWYMTAQLDAALEYVVRGRILENEVYTSFTVSEAPCRGCFASRVLQYVNAGSLALAGAREYSLLLSRERPEALPTGMREWLKLRPAEGHVAQLIVRHYVERKLSVQRDPLCTPHTVPDVSISPARCQPF
jgi:hypothetical protein